MSSQIMLAISVLVANKTFGSQRQYSAINFFNTAEILLVGTLTLLLYKRHVFCYMCLKGIFLKLIYSTWNKKAGT